MLIDEVEKMIENDTMIRLANCASIFPQMTWFATILTPTVFVISGFIAYIGFVTIMQKDIVCQGYKMVPFVQ